MSAVLLASDNAMEKDEEREKQVTLVSSSYSTSAALDETHSLTVEETYESLSNLGHNKYGCLVLTMCNLSNHHLDSITGLETYIQLQHISLDSNALTSLQPLKALPNLTYLSARRNRLTADVFACLHLSAMCLERLHLDHNNIEVLDGIPQFPYLSDLSCSFNRITELRAAQFAASTRLMRLTLSSNTIDQVEGGTLYHSSRLRVLDLSHNRVKDISFLRRVSPHLEVLRLNHNAIVSVGRYVKQLRDLATLDMDNNQLASLDEIEELKPLRALRTLSFGGNAMLRNLDTLFKKDEAADAPPELQGDDDPVAAESSFVPSPSDLHAEVVMSDDDEVDNWDHSTIKGPIAASADATNDAVPLDRNKGTNLGRGASMFASVNSFSKKARNSSSAGHSSKRLTSVIMAPARRGTTAEYVALAAPEVHEYTTSLGGAPREAELNFGINRMQDVLALPHETQVYLWTLYHLPHLTTLNHVETNAEDVARAFFFFHDEER